jgi:catechol 2,3-dioxygenase-like lactoylglutathione lyase family enzyme
MATELGDPVFVRARDGCSLQRFCQQLALRGARMGRSEGVNMLLDHLILRVNDVERSVRFYTDILGLAHEGKREPFTILRVTADFTIQLAPWGTQGGEHLAFAMSHAELTEVFRRVRDTGVPFGDSFHTVGNMKGPGEEHGARGLGASLYFFDPNEHLIEIRHYE